MTGWAGHWRGSNATSETVICDLSYVLRKPLEGMCMFGWDAATGATNFYWASDLMHRLFHVPKIGEGVVGHYSAEDDEHAAVITLATENATYAVRNSDTLQFFALEVYAHDIAVPGLGCPGTAAPSSSSVDSTSSAAAISSTIAPASASAIPAQASAAISSVQAPAASAVASATSRASMACTPHDDHW